MPPLSRRSLLAALGATLATAGCLSETGGQQPADTTEDSPSATETTSASPAETSLASPTETTPNSTTTGDTTTPNSTATASDTPDPDHSVTAANRSDQTRTVRVWVVREATGETVFETTTELPPGTETDELYNLKQADPDGIEAFTVCGKPKGGDAGSKHCATMRTSSCYADAHVTVQDDGSVQVIYAVC